MGVFLVWFGAFIVLLLLLARFDFGYFRSYSFCFCGSGVHICFCIFVGLVSDEFIVYVVSYFLSIVDLKFCVILLCV